MARPLRFVYPGAVYHVMARGDGGKAIFIEKEDHRLFLHGLGGVCGSHGWRVHAWVLMGNHFHLLLETPEANLVSGMRRGLRRGQSQITDIEWGHPFTLQLRGGRTMRSNCPVGCPQAASEE